MAVATDFYYEKVSRSMRAAIVSYLVKDCATGFPSGEQKKLSDDLESRISNLLVPRHLLGRS